jgi:predicted amidohydrolase
METLDVALVTLGGLTDGQEACAAAHASVSAAAAAGAELICLPQWSFAPCVAATRDRAGLELAERAPAPAWRTALAAAGPAWLAASAYESEGEGVFYLTARLAPGGAGESGAAEAGAADGAPPSEAPVGTAYRQRRLGATRGRYEQLFCSPGHGSFAIADSPWGRTGLLVGLDAADPQAWAALAARGARLVVGGVAEDEESWNRLCALARGMAAAHGLAVALANRGGEEHGVRFAGGGYAVAAGGEELSVGEGGRVAVPVAESAPHIAQAAPGIAQAAPGTAAPREDEQHEEQPA